MLRVVQANSGAASQSFIVKCARSLCAGVRATCAVEDNFVGSVSSIYFDTGLEIKLRLSGLCEKCFYQLSHLADQLLNYFLKNH